VYIARLRRPDIAEGGEPALKIDVSDQPVLPESGYFKGA
jgi:hypothetical protein